MARKTRTAPQLQAIVHERLHTVENVKADGSKFRVPLPYPHAPDKDGCNWNMNVFGNPDGQLEAVAKVLEEVRKEFNLSQ